MCFIVGNPGLDVSMYIEGLIRSHTRMWIDHEEDDEDEKEIEI